MDKFCILGVFLACSLIGFEAHAQWTTDTPSVQTEQQVAARLATGQGPATQALPADNLNRAVLTQNGNQNTGQVNQQFIGAFLSGNVVNLTQAGDLNTAVLNQTGSGLLTDLTQQGTGNQVQSNIVGDNITSTMGQDGVGNQINQELSVNDRAYLIQQQGNNNVLEQRESTVGTPQPGYEVRMVGNGIRITVEQGVGLPQR